MQHSTNAFDPLYLMIFGKCKYPIQYITNFIFNKCAVLRKRTNIDIAV